MSHHYSDQRKHFRQNKMLLIFYQHCLIQTLKILLAFVRVVSCPTRLIIYISIFHHPGNEGILHSNVLGQNRVVQTLLDCKNCCKAVTNQSSLHYRLRAIRGGPFKVADFASHFICIQIFQMPLILSESKYIRYNFRG